MSATDCACGCGKPTLLGRIAPLAAEGKSRRQIAAETGMSYGHVKLVLAKPPRYIQGHFRNEPDAYLKRRITIIETNRFERLRLADYVARGRRLNNGKLLRDGAAQARAAALRTSVLAADIKAFDLGLMVASFKPREYAAPGVALGIRETYRVERLAAQFGRAQRTRQERERVTDQILWLREQVGRGWRQDAPPLAERYMFSSLDALTTADDGGNCKVGAGTPGTVGSHEAGSEGSTEGSGDEPEGNQWQPNPDWGIVLEPEDAPAEGDSWPGVAPAGSPTERHTRGQPS